MTTVLSTTDANFSEALEALLVARSKIVSDVAPAVREMIAAVRTQGDTALIAFTKQFDRLVLQPPLTSPPQAGGIKDGKAGGIKVEPGGIKGGLQLRIAADEIAKAQRDCDPAVVEALTVAADRIRRYHETQMPESHRYTDAEGVTLGWQYAPLESVGLYVPGGKASYPSSVLMNAIPARVAGVDRVAMVVPTPGGAINPAVLVAARLAGVDEIYRVGGAQAVAALAYGTATIAPVAKIVGPGNAYVTEAKRQVYGRVGIDGIAGPSEILILADAKNNPAWIAADLLSQAEHDEMAQSILITNDERFAESVRNEVVQLLDIFPKSPARTSWERFGAIVRVTQWSEALPIIAQIAPEHLELAIDQPEGFSAHVRGAGAIFLGRHTPEAFGDYLAGPSHVLPTSRAARFSGGLSVFDFLNRTSVIGAPEAPPAALFEAAATLADAEGLPFHALSLRTRL